MRDKIVLSQIYCIDPLRGADITQDELFSFRTLEDRIPQKHPLRKVADLLLATLDDEFDALYARRGRDSIPPEHLLRTILRHNLASEALKASKKGVEFEGIAVNFNSLLRQMRSVFTTCL